jgi:hypothetical protein
MTHRVKMRDKQTGGIMWMLQTSAGGAAAKEDSTASTDREVDRILGKIIDTV